MNDVLLTAEAARQIEEALDKARIGLRDWELPENRYAALNAINQALSTIRAARAQEQAALAWHDKIKGMEVSMDVSTGEDDAHYRIFGRVDGVMLQSCGAQEDTILVIEDSRNYAAPVEPVKQEPVMITPGGGAFPFAVVGEIEQAEQEEKDDY